MVRAPPRRPTAEGVVLHRRTVEGQGALRAQAEAVARVGSAPTIEFDHRGGDRRATRSSSSPDRVFVGRPERAGLPEHLVCEELPDRRAPSG